MVKPQHSLETRIAELESQLSALHQRVAQISQKLDLPAIEGSPPAPAGATGLLGDQGASEGLVSWMGSSSLLPRLATLCFVMVIALVLRTMTDSDVVDKQIGSVLGMVFATSLMVLGWYKYRAASPIAPIFSISGAMLMFSIVVETHAHFESLPSVPAYAILLLTGAGMAFTSLRHKVALPIFIGALGMCFAGVAIDYPQPMFPYLATLLLSANVIGVFANRLQRCSWLRWMLLAVTVVVMQGWSFKLGIFLSRKATPSASLAEAWFLPMVFLFGLTFLAISLLGILRKGEQKITKFDLALPTLTVLWTFGISASIYLADKTPMVGLGSLGMTSALGLLGIAWLLGNRQRESAPGTNAFSLAGALLLALAFPAVTGSVELSLPFLSALALILAHVSGRWQSGGVRGTSYLLQIYACTALAIVFWGSEPATPSVVKALAAAAPALFGLQHFRWCRRNPPPEASRLFNLFDPTDRSAIFMLLAAMVSGFFALRVGLYQAVFLGAGALNDYFAAAQAVLINASAAGLMLLALQRRNTELRNVAIMVTIIGGLKVFMFDLFNIHGMPLVLSVFSFGLVAALESLTLSRWPRGEIRTRPGADTPS